MNQEDWRRIHDLTDQDLEAWRRFEIRELRRMALMLALYMSLGSLGLAGLVIFLTR